MSEYIETAKQYISEGNEEEALKLARKRHGKDDAESYIAILDLLIENGNGTMAKSTSMSISPNSHVPLTCCVTRP